MATPMTMVTKLIMSLQNMRFQFMSDLAARDLKIPEA
jgi:hypothetical protein